MKDILVKIAIILAILILAIVVFYGAFYFGKTEGRAVCQSENAVAKIEHDKKLEATYDNIENSIPADRADRAKWLLRHVPKTKAGGGK